MRFHDIKITKIWYRLFQGCYADAEELKYANPYGITFVLNCTPDPIEYPAAYGISTRTIAINDGYEIPAAPFWSAMGCISGVLQSGGVCLVNCHAGISRSTIMVAGYMAMCGYDTLDNCIAHIKELRSVVLPHPLVLKSVKQHLKEWPYNDPNWK